MYGNDKSPLVIKADAFATRVIRMVKYLRYHSDSTFTPIYTQILKSGTSISANVGEAQYAQSRADFITKLHIATKEANETLKWLRALLEAEVITAIQYQSMCKDADEIISILVASLKTAKRNSQQIIK